MRLLTIIFTLIIVGSSGSLAQPFPHSPQPWQDAYNISMADFEFSHPATVFNAVQRDTIINRIANQKEPQYLTYQQLMGEAQNLLAFTPQPPASMNIMGGYEPDTNLEEMREILWTNSYAAYTTALAYNISGNIQFAEKAVEILNAWASTGTTFIGADRGLQLGSFFNSMLYAADLLHGYENWQPADRDTFETWWRNKILDDGNVLNVMRTRDNNWKDAAILGVISAAVVFEDTLLLKEAVIQLTSYFYERTDGNVNNPGVDWKITNDDLGTYLLREVVRNEGKSGLTYTAYSLTTMVQAMEIARNAGFDLWEKETAQGANMQKLISQYFDWSVLNLPFPWNSNPNKTSARRNAFEIANNYFDLGETFQNWIAVNRPLNGQQGDAWTTFTKGLTGETVAGGTDSLKFERIYLEAENAAVEAPMVIQTDTLASADQYVMVPAGNRSTGSVPETGKTTFTVYLKGGTYRIWARVIAPNPESDSYWVQLNDQPAFFWNKITNSGSWIWVPVHVNNDTNAPWSFSVTEDEHNITFHLREDNAQLDMIFLSNDGSLPNDNDPEVDVVVPQQYELSISVNPPNAGFTSGAGFYYPGTEITLIPYAYQGYAFMSWTDQNQNPVVLSNNVFTMPGNDVVLTANFQSTTNIINPQANASNLKVYPNPTNGLTTIEFPGSINSSATIELFNMMGQTVFTKQIESNDSGQETFDLSYLEKGLYWVLFRTGEKIFSTPLQIVK
jgi:hypothetical protein